MICNFSVDLLISDIDHQVSCPHNEPASGFASFRTVPKVSHSICADCCRTSHSSAEHRDPAECGSDGLVAATSAGRGAHHSADRCSSPRQTGQLQRSVGRGRR